MVCFVPTFKPAVIDWSRDNACPYPTLGVVEENLLLPA
jgi:hypothetical protein